MEQVHCVAGAGPVGRALALQLADSGHRVTLVTRSGSGPEHPGIDRVALDVASTEALMQAVPQAAAIYNCVNPPYHRWPQEWPPMATSFLSYAERTGAVLVTCSNLYGYGPKSAPLVETMPLDSAGTKGRIRADMWLQAKALNDAGRIRATEVRGSDYITPSDQSGMGDRVVPRILAGKGVQVLGSADQPHTWTSPKDVARLMAIIAQDSRAWGAAWHVPSNPARTQREAVNDLADAAGVAHVKVSTIPAVAVRALGLVNPLIRELKETDYQFRASFVLDDTAARTTFGMSPTPWSEMLAEQVAAYR